MVMLLPSIFFKKTNAFFILQQSLTIFYLKIVYYHDLTALFRLKILEGSLPPRKCM